MTGPSPWPIRTDCPECYGTGHLAPTPAEVGYRIVLCPRGCGGTPDGREFAAIHAQRLLAVGEWVGWIDVGMLDAIHDLWEARIPTWISCEATGCGYGPYVSTLGWWPDAAEILGRHWVVVDCEPRVREWPVVGVVYERYYFLDTMPSRDLTPVRDERTM